MENRSFTKFWLIIAAAFLLVGLILIAWFVSLEANEKESFERYNQQQLLLIEGTAVGIEGLFDDLAASLSSLGSLPVVQYFDEALTRQELLRKLDELTPRGITDIGILNASGVAQTFAVETEAEGIDYSWRSYFRAARETDPGNNPQPLIVELQTVSPGELGFKIAIPLFETAIDSNHPVPSGEFAGAIVGSLTLDTLVQRHIAPFQPPGDGHIWLVDDQYDIIWSSDAGLLSTNLLDKGQAALSVLADQMDLWETDTHQGGYYAFEKPSGWNDFELIAFAPVKIGNELMAVGVKTPEEVARQTSLANFQSQQFVFIISMLTLFVGVVVGGLVLGREVRRRARVEAALKKSELEQAIVTERNRLAGDLHDSVTQGLYGIVLHADAAQGQLSAGNDDRVTEFLEEIKAAGKEGLAEMRLLIFELRPPVLEREGLAAALETRLYTVEKRAGLQTEIQADVEGRLPLEIEDGLYRIAQETLNNALKHAQAQHIWVHLQQAGPMVKLEIADDGRGFEIDTALKSGGLGFTGMQERATKLGGQLTIQSNPGAGTRITVEVKV